MKNTKKISKDLILFLKGFVMGIAEIIPGVSGSTLALILGIYRDFISLLYQISNFAKEVFKFIILKSNFSKILKVFRLIDFRFGLILFLGMLFAIALFSNIVNFLFLEYREYVLAFFFGLVLASVVIPWGEIKKKKPKHFFIVIIVAIIFFFILSLRPQVFEVSPSPLYFLFAGSLGICAMVLPGVSGSFIFLLLGVYEYIVLFISNFTKFQSSQIEILSLLSLAVGIIVGFILFVRVLQYALKSYSDVIFAVLTGIMLASLRVLWPFAESVGLVSLLLVILIGFSLVLILKFFKNDK